MIITHSKFNPALIVGPAYQGEKPGRSAGLHLSTIYRDIEVTVGTADNSASEEELEAYGALGFIWEHVLANGLRMSLMSDSVVHPGEFMVDGVIGSPDLVDVTDPDYWIVWDTKVTWKSSHKLDNLEKYFWKWLMQGKGYCRMVGSTHFRLLVMCVCGTWKPPKPSLHQIDIKFSPREIADNWEMILNHAKKRGWL